MDLRGVSALAKVGWAPKGHLHGTRCGVARACAPKTIVTCACAGPSQVDCRAPCSGSIACAHILQLHGRTLDNHVSPMMRPDARLPCRTVSADPRETEEARHHREADAESGAASTEAKALLGNGTANGEHSGAKPGAATSGSTNMLSSMAGSGLVACLKMDSAALLQYRLVGMQWWLAHLGHVFQGVGGAHTRLCPYVFDKGTRTCSCAGPQQLHQATRSTKVESI